MPSGTEFLYKVSAINSVGTGAPNTKSITISEQEKSPIPGPPKGLTLTLASPSQINLVWLPPDDDGGEPITGYKIEYRIGTGSYQTVNSNTKSNTTQYEHKGLSSSEAYYYRVSAINSAGESIPTIESQIIIQLDEPEPEPKVIPDFIDTENDPQYYLDRYYNEEAYKAWFDSTYPDYTIEEAIVLAYPEPKPEPKPILDFVDPDRDPQYYIDRYNNEATYKKWFDKNYPDYTIEEAVGVTTPIPGWIKNNAKWWSEGLITEDDFVKGIEYLVEKRIIQVS